MNIKYREEDFIGRNGQIMKPLSGFRIFQKRQTRHVERQRPYATNDAIFSMIVDLWTYGLTENARQIYKAESRRMAEQYKKLFPEFQYKRPEMTKSSANSPSAPTNLVKPVNAQASSQQKDVDTARAIVNSTSNQITVFLKKAKLQFEHWSPEPINRKRKLVDDDAVVTNPKKTRQDYGLPVQFMAKVPRY